MEKRSGFPLSLWTAKSAAPGYKFKSEVAFVKNFLIRILLAAALTLVTFGLASSAHAQQADEDPVPATPNRQEPATAPKSPSQQQVPASSSDDAQIQQALAFSGRVTRERGQLVLKDPVTRMTYQLDNPAKAKQYIGKKVKVIGILEMKSNTIHIDSIEPLS
jgi:Protein of unknown function (DUF5818)